MSKYPKIDLPPAVDDLVVKLQFEHFFDTTHTISEDNSYFFNVAHKAIRLGTDAGIESPALRNGVDIGIKTFEALGYLTHPDQTYDDEVSKAFVFAGALKFVESLKSTDGYLTVADYARARMEEDAPLLTDAIMEVAGRHTNHDPVATLFAVRGAAMIRGMQIFVDRRLEAAA